MLSLNILLFLSLAYLSTVYSQNCAYIFDSSLTLFPKDRKISDEVKLRTESNIDAYNSCLEFETDSLRIFWLHNAIAMYSIGLEYIDQQKIIEHAKSAFVYSERRLCEDYIKINLYFENNADFPMKRHYLDQLDGQAIKDICQYCHANYRQAKVDQYESIEKEESKIRSSGIYNSEYFKALKEIALTDQQQRTNSTIDWGKQNRLDSLNRIVLDSLFEIHGFPSLKTVTKEGAVNAFMVLHHSTECQWNQKWITRFLDNNAELELHSIMSFFFYRNYNPENGICKDNVKFIEDLEQGPHSKQVKEFMNAKY